MKKLTITIALLLVVALAMPVLADGHGSFSDVPSDHWAYNAINKLVAAGIVEGYPDGEFKGAQNMTRYEMAVMVSRALDNIVAEQEALANEVDEMGEGLTTGQAEDVTAIVKSLMEKNLPDQENLSDAQAEEVADIVDALTFELKAELKVLGAEVDTLNDDMDALAADVEALDIPEDNIEFGVTVDNVLEFSNYNGDAKLWLIQEDVFDLDDTADLFADKAFYQEAAFNISGSVANADYSLDLVALNNNFGDYNNQGEADAVDFKMESALLEVAYEGVNVKLGDMDGYAVESYFANEEDVEGMEMTTNYMGYDVKTFMGSSDDSFDIYGATVGRSLDMADVTAKVYHGRGDSGEETHLAGQLANVNLAEGIVMGTELVYDYENEGFYMTADATVTTVEALTLKPFVNYANDKFAPYKEDMDDEFTDGNGVLQVGADADYVLDENNTLSVGFTFTNDNEAEDKMVATGGIANTYGEFTNNASVEYTINDEYTADQTKVLVEADTAFALNAKTDLTADVSFEAPSYADNTTTFGAGADYAWNDSTMLTAGMSYENVENGNNTTVLDLAADYAWNASTDLGAEFTYKTVENNESYSFVNLTADKTLTDNISWNTEAHYITGEDSGVSSDGNGVKTSLSVSF